MQQIVLASNNQGKIREFKEIFKLLNIEIIPQSEFRVEEIDEPFTTFFENALHKARHCSKLTGLPALADDSGLCVESLNGAPGIYSARYAGEPKDNSKNIEKLLYNLQNKADKRAYFYCSLVLIKSDLDPTPVFAEGRLNGVIVNEKRGGNGFGYDPVFYLEEYRKTMAQLAPGIKNTISHRVIAIKNLMQHLKEGYYATQ